MDVQEERNEHCMDLLTLVLGLTSVYQDLLSACATTATRKQVGASSMYAQANIGADIRNGDGRQVAVGRNKMYSKYHEP